MKAETVYKLACAIMFEKTGLDPDFQTFFPGLATMLLQEALPYENARRETLGQPPLEEAPAVADMEDDIPFCDLICRDTGSTVQYQRLAIGNCLDLAQTVKAQTSPVCRILAVDVTDTCSQEVNAQLSDRLAFLRICQFTGRNDTVFFTADAADLTLDGNSLGVCQSDHFLGLLQVFLKCIVRSVEHYGCKAGFDAGLSTFIRTMVQVQSDRNGDAHAVMDLLHHCDDRLEAAHILGSTFRYT